MHTVAGKAALAMESYARALRQLPTIIADNGGFDSQELVTQLRAAHGGGNTHAGLNMVDGAWMWMCSISYAVCTSMPL